MADGHKDEFVLIVCNDIPVAAIFITRSCSLNYTIISNSIQVSHGLVGEHVYLKYLSPCGPWSLMFSYFITPCHRHEEDVITVYRFI